MKEQSKSVQTQRRGRRWRDGGTKQTHSRASRHPGPSHHRHGPRAASPAGRCLSYEAPGIRRSAARPAGRSERGAGAGSAPRKRAEWQRKYLHTCANTHECVRSCVHGSGAGVGAGTWAVRGVREVCRGAA